MPCKICGTDQRRDYEHSRNPYHLKRLMKIMKQKKKEAIVKHGVYFYNN